ncbi:hypothetical protein ABK040_005851 [Willaertia magna]
MKFTLVFFTLLLFSVSLLSFTFAAKSKSKVRDATTTVKIGDQVCIEPVLNLRTSPCGTIYTAVKTNGITGNVTNIVPKTSLKKVLKSCDLGDFTWVEIYFKNYERKLWAALETGLVKTCKSINIANVPYIHQVFDTNCNGNGFDGHWACGPTSTVMAVAHFGKLKERTTYCSGYVSQFGYYVSNEFKSNVTNHIFNVKQADPKGKLYAGAYGSITKDGAAWAYLVQDFATNNGLKQAFYSKATFDIISKAIDQGHLIVLSTQLTGAGHLILVRGYGYDSNGKPFLYVNDPYGNKQAGNYGTLRNGENIIYPYDYVYAKYMIEIWN